MAVYVVEAVGIGFIKIGFCGKADVASRILALQTGCPVRLEVLSVVTTFGRDDEAELHGRFQHARSHGEWFRATPEVRAWIATLTPAMKSRAQRYEDYRAEYTRTQAMSAEELRERLSWAIRNHHHSKGDYFSSIFLKIDHAEADVWRSYLYNSPAEGARWRKHNPSPHNESVALWVEL